MNTEIGRTRRFEWKWSLLEPPKTTETICDWWFFLPDTAEEEGLMAYTAAWQQGAIKEAVVSCDF